MDEGVPHRKASPGRLPSPRLAVFLLLFKDKQEKGGNIHCLQSKRSVVSKVDVDVISRAGHLGVDPLSMG